jgi:hypothetical protein
MKLKDLQPYDSLTFRNNRVYLTYAGSIWGTHNEDFTSKKNIKFDIVRVERDGKIIFEDEDYKRLHNVTN